jgi:hypothetical protein
MTLSEVMLPAILMLVGFAAVVILERSSGKPPGQSSV